MLPVSLRGDVTGMRNLKMFPCPIGRCHPQVVTAKLPDHSATFVSRRFRGLVGATEIKDPWSMDTFGWIIVIPQVLVASVFLCIWCVFDISLQNIATIHYPKRLVSNEAGEMLDFKWWHITASNHWICSLPELFQPLKGPVSSTTTQHSVRWHARNSGGSHWRPSDGEVWKSEAK